MLGDAAQPRPRSVARCLSFLCACRPLLRSCLCSCLCSRLCSCLCSALLCSEPEPILRPASWSRRGRAMARNMQSRARDRTSQGIARHVFSMEKGEAMNGSWRKSPWPWLVLLPFPWSSLLGGMAGW